MFAQCLFLFFLEVVQLLLARGADVNRANQAGRTGLHWACGVNGHSDVVQLLLEYGGDMSLTDNVSSDPTLVVCV